MESRVAMAVEKKRVCNCAQAVFCSYPDITGMDEALGMALAGAFGLGMGGMEATCGALAGAAMVMGRAFPEKGEAMKRMRSVVDEFGRRNGATRCRDLKGMDSGVPLRPCPGCVADACELLERELAAKYPFGK